MEQASRLTLSSRAFYNDQLGRYAKFMSEYFGYDMVLPMNTGAEAVETAMKLARKWGYLRKGIPDNEAIILAPSGNFHGRTLGVISLSTDPESRNDFGPFVPRVGAICPGTDAVLRYNNVDDLAATLDQHGEKVAALLIEPIQGEAGIVVPDEGYLRNCADLCKKHNVLLIADEIQTGLGRTGRLLAVDHEGIRPNMVILGKSLSGGVYPVSAVLADRDIMLCIKPGEHGSTYGGNPLACAVAMAALEVLREEDLASRAQVLGERFRVALRALNCPMLKVVRGKGLLNAIVVDEEKLGAGKQAWHLCLLLKRYGLLTKPTHDNIVRLSPPLCITEAQIDEAVIIIGKALNDIASWDLVNDPLE